ncbi:hypothetical protein HN51_067997 [Arachis hypogaea]|nr:uncharacterized protein DS421_14g481820 [Arachis hypogaea]
MKPILFTILLLLVPSSTLAARVAGERGGDFGLNPRERDPYGRGIGNAPRGRTPIHPPPIPASPNLAHGVSRITIKHIPIPRPRPRPRLHLKCNQLPTKFRRYCSPPSN